jgi:UDP-GlcNAc3NAcA epimerase
MSQVFFDELNLPEPDVNLGVGSGNHGWQTGQMLIRIEEVLLAEKPDWTLVYGDTNSTLAGALAAVKLHIPMAHVEAGLRSFNREMPEEHNRVLTDHCADLLFCPTQIAVNNLAREAITEGVHFVGDTMYDAVLQFGEIARQHSTILQDLSLEPKHYLLATVHRPYNTDDPAKLGAILQAFIECDQIVIFPVHPRTRQKISEFNLLTSQTDNHNLRLIDPVSYLDTLVLEQNARMILTDSGGMQKEAFFFAVPCITLRPETEWVETVQSGWNFLVSIEPTMINESIRNHEFSTQDPSIIYGDGRASFKIIDILERRYPK